MYDEQTTDQTVIMQPADGLTKLGPSTPTYDTSAPEHGHKSSVDSGRGSSVMGGRSSCSGGSNFSSCAASPASADGKTVQRNESK